MSHILTESDSEVFGAKISLISADTNESETELDEPSPGKMLIG